MRRESGSMILPLCLILAVVSALIFLYANDLVRNIGKQYSTTQAMSYAHQISATLARQLRRSYDIGRHDQLQPLLPVARQSALMCTMPGASIVMVGTAPLCLVGGRTCTRHPGNGRIPPICVRPTDGTLIAKLNFIPRLRRSSTVASFASLAFPFASAQSISPYAPAAPNAAEAISDLTAPPVCLGAACGLVCGANADCLSFSFCPTLSGNCSVDQIVSQTIAFPR